MSDRPATASGLTLVRVSPTTTTSRPFVQLNRNEWNRLIGCSGGAIKLYIALSHAVTGEYSPDTPLLQEQLQLSRTSLHRDRRELVESGLIVTERRGPTTLGYKFPLESALEAPDNG